MRSALWEHPWCRVQGVAYGHATRCRLYAAPGRSPRSHAASTVARHRHRPRPRPRHIWAFWYCSCCQVTMESVCVWLVVGKEMRIPDGERVERAGRMFGFRTRRRGCGGRRRGALDHPTRGEARYRRTLNRGGARPPPGTNSLLSLGE